MPLYLVSTPIGNLSDLTLRAAEILKTVDLVAAEDTRHSQTLLSHIGARTRFVSYHDHNKHDRVRELLPLLLEGKRVALISDAGTPGIADPGFHLIRAALEAGVQVVPVPGPSAMLAALVASGLPTDRFVFENFLPFKEGRRRTKLASLKAEERTVILYESPHRILKALDSIVAVLGDITLVVARELTKLHETFYRGRASEIKAQLAKEGVRGEFVVLFNLRIQNGVTAAPDEPESDDKDDNDDPPS